MKQLLKITLTFFITFSFANCEKDDDDNNSQAQPSAISQEEFFEVTVDGTSYSTSNLTVTTVEGFINVAAPFSSSAAAELEFASIPITGSMQTSSQQELSLPLPLKRGFATKIALSKSQNRIQIIDTFEVVLVAQWKNFLGLRTPH